MERKELIEEALGHLNAVSPPAEHAHGCENAAWRSGFVEGFVKAREAYPLNIRIVTLDPDPNAQQVPLVFVIPKG